MGCFGKQSASEKRRSTPLQVGSHRSDGVRTKSNSSALERREDPCHLVEPAVSRSRGLDGLGKIDDVDYRLYHFKSHVRQVVQQVQVFCRFGMVLLQICQDGCVIVWNFFEL